MTDEVRLVAINAEDAKMIAGYWEDTPLGDRFNWQDAITEKRALRIAQLADNWLDEYHDERNDPDVAAFRAAFNPEEEPFGVKLMRESMERGEAKFNPEEEEQE